MSGTDCTAQYKPTESGYGMLQEAFDHFNECLFDGELPQVYLTLSASGRSRGYFCSERFESRDGDKAFTHEIALNPDAFEGRTDEQIFSTLAHEMCHVWQEEFGKQTRRGYHDRQWAAKMKEIGLHPSNTGEPGGKETGQQMTHYVLDGGPFQRAYKAMADTLQIAWQGRLAGLVSAKGSAAKKKPTRCKYTCPECNANAWAKYEASLGCGECSEAKGEFVKMEAEDDDD